MPATGRALERDCRAWCIWKIFSGKGTAAALQLGNTAELQATVLPMPQCAGKAAEQHAAVEQQSNYGAIVAGNIHRRSLSIVARRITSGCCDQVPQI